MKITKDQLKDLQALQDKRMAAAKNGAILGAVRLNAILTSLDKKMADVLTAEQRKRIKQLERQRQGAMGPFLSPELNLPNEQKLRIVKIILDEAPAGRRIRESVGTPDEKAKKLAEFNKKSLDKVLKALTPAQREQWKELAGEPYKGVLPPGYGDFTLSPQFMPPQPKK